MSNEKLISNNIQYNNNIIMEESDSIKTMRYLGNKTDLLTFIESIIQNYTDKLNPFWWLGCVTHILIKKDLM